MWNREKQMKDSAIVMNDQQMQQTEVTAVDSRATRLQTSVISVDYMKSMGYIK